MKLLTPFVSATIVACCLSFSVHAQTDSTRLDAGSLILQKEFTQGIVIKGEDLEKMPFASLTDAINAWAYGVYTRSTDLIYVVDGNLLSDVNAYSVYDIEEIVLVQDATVLVNTGGSQRQLVLITTRRGKGRSGFRAAARSSLVSMSGRKTGIFHQYYTGVDKSAGAANFGISADYLHDMYPSMKGPEIGATTPFNLDRWRLNAYFTFQVGSKNSIEVHLNYSPQLLDSAEVTSLYSGPGHVDHNVFHQSQNLFTPWARWHGVWLPGLTNDLQTGYLSSLNKGYVSQHYVPVDPSMQDGYDYNDKGSRHTDHVFIRDHLIYHQAMGNWVFAPSLDASYEHIKNRYTEDYLYQSSVNMEVANNIFSEQGTIYILTPAVDLSYKHALDIRGGIVANVSHVSPSDNGIKPERVLPFAGISLNLLRFGNADSKAGLTLFGSYAKRGAWGANDYAMTDLNGINAAFSPQPIVSAINYSGTINSWGGLATHVSRSWVWQAGAGYTTADGRVELNYHFERRNFVTQGFSSSPGGIVVFVFSDWTSSLHYFGMNVKLLEGKGLQWRAGLNTTVLRSKTGTYANEFIPNPTGAFLQGDNGIAWTGGWVNRLEYGAFGAGVDLLYHFHEALSDYTTGMPPYTHQGSLKLQHIYASYRMALHGDGSLEVYLDGRGLMQGSNSTLPDQRMYYGVGGKLTI